MAAQSVAAPHATAAAPVTHGTKSGTPFECVFAACCAACREGTGTLGEATRATEFGAGAGSLSMICAVSPAVVLTNREALPPLANCASSETRPGFKYNRCCRA